MSRPTDEEIDYELRVQAARAAERQAAASERQADALELLAVMLGRVVGPDSIATSTIVHCTCPAPGCPKHP